MEIPKILLVGLGNPGPKYHDTRHNIGFIVLDLYAHREGYTFSNVSRPCPFAVASKKNHGRHVFLLKPYTYMNKSGEAVFSLMQYYKISISNILVVHDDLDIPLGNLKFVREGGSGGHKGIKSVIERLGSNAFPRLKLGIGRPEKEISVEKYVLSSFNKEEKKSLERLLDVACDGLTYFLEQGIEAAMNQFNAIRIDVNG